MLVVGIKISKIVWLCKMVKRQTSSIFVISARCLRGLVKLPSRKAAATSLFEHGCCKSVEHGFTPALAGGQLDRHEDRDVRDYMQGFSSRLSMGVRNPRHVRCSPHLRVHIFRLLFSCCLILPAHWYRGSEFACSQDPLLRTKR